MEEADGKIERTLYPATNEDLTKFNLLFSMEARKNLTDQHLWFSVVHRPILSTFTRVQRASCCLSLLLCSMLANAMFYQVDDSADSGTMVKIGPFRFSVRQISIGITSSLVVIPVNVFIVNLFRRARPKSVENHPDSKARKYQVSKEQNDEEEQPEKKAKKANKEMFLLPHYFVYVAYVVCFLSCAASATVTIFYSLTFGKEKAEAWLTSIMVSFWQDVFVLQPIKVFVLAMVFALFTKDPNKTNGNEQPNELGDNEEWVHDRQGGHEETSDFFYFVPKPPNEETLHAVRQIRIKEKQMRGIIRELVFYFTYLIVLCIVAYGNRDSQAYHVTEAMVNLFKEGKYTQMSTFDSVSIPQDIQHGYIRVQYQPRSYLAF